MKSIIFVSFKTIVMPIDGLYNELLAWLGKALKVKSKGNLLAGGE